MLPPRRMPLDEVLRFRPERFKRLTTRDLVHAWAAYWAPVVDPSEETVRILVHPKG